MSQLTDEERLRKHWSERELAKLIFDAMTWDLDDALVCQARANAIAKHILSAAPKQGVSDA